MLYKERQQNLNSQECIIDNVQSIWKSKISRDDKKQKNLTHNQEKKSLSRKRLRRYDDDCLNSYYEFNNLKETGAVFI